MKVERKLALTQAPNMDEREETGEIAAPTPPAKRSRAKVLLAVLAGAAALAAGISYWMSRGAESTDDAQVEGHVATVAARVSGQVKRVLVKDNQAVKAGDVLVELDNRDLTARLAAARADQRAAAAAVHAAETQLALADTSSRSNLSVARGGMTQASALEDTTRAAIDQARSDVAGARPASRSRKPIAIGRSACSTTLPSQRPRWTRAGRRSSRPRPPSRRRARGRSAPRHPSATRAARSETARGRLLAAQAGPEQVESARAQLELAAARVAQARRRRGAGRAQPLVHGRARRARAAPSRGAPSSPGQTVSPERPLMAIVGLDDTWIVANFKEDQIAAMRPGQAAEVRVDTFGGRASPATSRASPPGTGSRFSLLPPDNASGNFTKVVQRVPVLIRLDAGRRGVALRPGMSADVSVTTAH